MPSAPLRESVLSVGLSASTMSLVSVLTATHPSEAAFLRQTADSVLLLDYGQAGVVVRVVVLADPEQVARWRTDAAQAAEGAQLVVFEDDGPQGP